MRIIISVLFLFRVYVLSTEDRTRLKWIEKQFKKISGKGGNITFANFKKALGAKKTYFAERVFTLFDTNNSNTIDLSELIDGAELLLRGSPNDKLKFLFD
ncbi:hypothetical protein KUTeg_009008 [Tegillarca granosa]|uniref:EF-hand domain-containing protein n=1 Tax=Tegillarca granosa TaxID=220873 RepID=A0ABQ9FAQ9_TEGGR|nr:hypothetical protein KUTeg_009008 [Tegillarca granosa]